MGLNYRDLRFCTPLHDPAVNVDDDLLDLKFTPVADAEDDDDDDDDGLYMPMLTMLALRLKSEMCVQSLRKIIHRTTPQKHINSHKPHQFAAALVNRNSVQRKASLDSSLNPLWTGGWVGLGSERKGFSTFLGGRQLSFFFGGGLLMTRGLCGNVV